MRWSLFVVCGLLFAGCMYGVLAEDVRSQLVQGVTEIAAPGIPGPLVLISPNAVPIVCAQANEGVFEPVVAAVRWGVPISQQAREAVKHLPVWMPRELQE